MCFQIQILAISCLLILVSCTAERASHSSLANKAKALETAHLYKVPPINPKKTRPYQDPQLEQLLSVALSDNPDLGIAKARIEMARQIARGAYSSLWPSAGLKTSASQYHFSFQGVVPPPFNQATLNQASIADLGMNFNYELDLWGKNRANFASKLDEHLASRMELEQTRLILEYSVTSVWFQLQEALAQEKLAKDNIRLLQESENIVIDRAKQGVQSDIPVKTAISNTQSAKLALEDYARMSELAKHQLTALIGKNPFNTKIETTPFQYHKKQLQLPTIIPANLLGSRPDIIATRARASSAAHQIKVAKTAFYPNINLSGILSLQSFYFTKLFHVAFETEGAKAALELPIFDAGARKANLGIKYAEFDMAVEQYQKTILNALKEVKDNLSNLRTTEKQIQSQNLALEATKTNYDLFLSRYKEGIIDYIQVLEIKQLLNQEQARLIHLQALQKQAHVALLTSLGGDLSYDRAK